MDLGLSPTWLRDPGDNQRWHRLSSLRRRGIILYNFIISARRSLFFTVRQIDFVCIPCNAISINKDEIYSRLCVGGKSFHALYIY